MTAASTTTATANLVEPQSAAEIASALAELAGTHASICPVGGGTCLDASLLPAERGSTRLSLARLDRLIDYPSRDMTVTVEAGMRVADLVELLAGENQRLPIDVPQAAQATIGGVVATAVSGPGRYRHGTVRDYVIGISAIDGRGTIFKAGGRVVKNVAGYDFCKLLTGSWGTLAVITQVTLKVKPRSQVRRLVYAKPGSHEKAEALLATLVRSQTTPLAIELLAGPAWRSDPAFTSDDIQGPRLLVAFEGSEQEVAWSIEQIGSEWRAAGSEPFALGADESDRLWNRLVEFSASAAPLTLKYSVLPGRVCELAESLDRLAPEASVLAHAGNGIVLASFDGIAPAEAASQIVKQLQPLAVRAGGNVVIYWAAAPEQYTPQAFWGAGGADRAQMRAVKAQFDPHNLLNPGRFVY